MLSFPVSFVNPLKKFITIWENRRNTASAIFNFARKKKRSKLFCVGATALRCNPTNCAGKNLANRIDWDFCVFHRGEYQKLSCREVQENFSDYPA